MGLQEDSSIFSLSHIPLATGFLPRKPKWPRPCLHHTPPPPPPTEKALLFGRDMPQTFCAQDGYMEYSRRFLGKKCRTGKMLNLLWLLIEANCTGDL